MSRQYKRLTEVGASAGIPLVSMNEACVDCPISWAGLDDSCHDYVCTLRDHTECEKYCDTCVHQPIRAAGGDCRHHYRPIAGT